MLTKYAKEANEYTNILLRSVAGKPGREYMAKRGILPETAKAWGLGYCPVGYVPKCYADRLRTLPSKSRFWEKMHGRITIPIADSSGNIIAISGRAIYPVNEAKYMHYVFPTSKILFGLWMNRKNIFDLNTVVFVEGQLDVITSWQSGMKCTVSCFGAHFTEYQLALAARYTNKVYILFDDDEAGKTGAKASISKISHNNIVKVVLSDSSLLQGKDLDEYIRSGKDWRELIKN